MARLPRRPGAGRGGLGRPGAASVPAFRPGGVLFGLVAFWGQSRVMAEHQAALGMEVWAWAEAAPGTAALVVAATLLFALCIHQLVSAGRQFVGPNSQVAPLDKVRIVHWSDTHNFLTDQDADELPSGDVFIHSGDFAHNGSKREFKLFNRWLEKIKTRFPVRIVVFGNHDLAEFKDVWRQKGGLKTMKALLPAATHVLVHESVHVHGLSIFGSPWNWFQNAKYQSWYTLATAGPKYDLCPAATNVLVTHGPARGVLDLDNSGCPHLISTLDLKSIQLHLHGHIHETRGVATRPHGCLTVNSSACGKITARGIVNKPHVIEYDRASNRFQVIPS